MATPEKILVKKKRPWIRSLFQQEESLSFDELDSEQVFSSAS